MTIARLSASAARKAFSLKGNHSTVVFRGRYGLAATSIAAMIAAPVLAKLKLAIASVDAQRKSIELCVENKNGDVPSILKELKEAKSEAANTAKIMRAQLVVAKSLAVPAAPAPAGEGPPLAAAA